MMQLTLELAEKMAKIARAKAAQMGIAITVSIVDEADRLVLTMKGDNTGSLIPETSHGKALDEPILNVHSLQNSWIKS